MTTAEPLRNDQPIRLTQFSHGAGCGCKIAPDVLETILRGSVTGSDDTTGLLIGNNTRYEAVRGCSADSSEIREAAASLVLKWDGSFKARANKLRHSALGWLAMADAE